MQRADHLFVYGSLRADAGHEMHRVLAEGASFVGKGSVPGALYHLGWHPGAVPSRRPGECVRGEIYRLHDPDRLLPVLDRYEGCGPEDALPHRFERERVEASLDGGGRTTCWIYWHRGEIDEAARVESGDWVPGA